MIGKVVKPGKGFRGLFNYLLKGPRTRKSAKGRVAWIEMRNLLIEDVELAPSLMRATAAKSKRVEKPVYHVVISWEKAYRPSDTMMLEVADTTCMDMGLEDYQRVYFAHDDTDHRHVHMVVNRVHPETGVAWRTSKDYEIIEKSLKRQAEGYGIDYVPGRHNSPERFKDVPRRPRSTEVKLAKEKGVAPLGRWSKERILKERDRLGVMFDASASWEMLGAQLASLGLTLIRKGQGIVITDGTGTMKLSELGKDIRLKGLEERFQAPFQAMPAPRPPEEPKPIDKRTDKPVSAKRQPRRETPHDRPRPVLGQSEMQKRWLAYSDAGSEMEMAVILYRMGMIGVDDVEKSMKSLKAAKDVVDRARPLLDQLSDLEWHVKVEEQERKRRKAERKARSKDRDRGGR